MVGGFEEQLADHDYTLRCLQFFLSLQEPFAEAGKRLASLGHRKVMMATLFSDSETERIRHTLEQQFVAARLAADCIDANWHPLSAWQLLGWEVRRTSQEMNATTR